MTQLYHPSIYDFDQAVPSYWEATAPPHETYAPLQGDERCDVAVIGGGYTGLSTALHLARDYGVDVRVLEAGHIGWGASGRNGGFCCLPATKLSVAQMIKRYGLEETKRFYAAQLEGMELVRALGDDEGIDYERCGNGNLLVAHMPARFKELEDYAETLSRHFGIKTKLYSKQEFAELGHDSTEQFGAMHMAAGFALHPLKFAMGLGRAAARRGARLHAHSRVTAWRREGGEHHLVTAGGSLRARRVVMAANGFMPEGLHPAFDGLVLPALSNIVTTRPLSDEELAAQGWRTGTTFTETPVCNTRELLFYYRLLPDRRLLFGARGDTTGRPQEGERMRAWLTRRLGEVFPQWKNVPSSHFWRGLVCLTLKLAPSLGRLEDDPSVWYGFAYHANGVNSAPWTGMILARLMAGSNSGAPSGTRALPGVVAGLPRRIPLPALRLWGLRAAYLYYRYRDDKA